MKLLLVLFALAAVASARPQEPQVLAYSNNVGVQGYDFKYELSDKTAHEETGELKNAGAENEAIVVRGSYSFVAPDGQVYTVNYVADENGYQPQGAHLPARR